MDIAFVNSYNVKDISQYSGAGYYISKTFEQQFTNLEYVSPLKEKYSLLFKSKSFIYKKLRNKRYLREREPFIIRDYAQQLSQKLSKIKTDIVFSCSTIPIAYLECEQPVVFWTDATFAGMIDFYPIYSNLCEESLKNGHAVEQTALQKCRLAIYTSEWAAQTAIDYYNIDPSKVKVVPFGANIHCNRNFEKIKSIIDARPKNICKLLFIGVEWHRKGGDKAVEVACKLNDMGLNVELSIVGCKPPIWKELPNFVKCLGHISKSTEAGRNIIDNLLAESHFLLLPSRAEAFGHVFCEASSFGVPSLTANVGGVATAVKDGRNGKIFLADANIKEYCNYIFDVFSNYYQYKELALSSFNEYESRLNWSVIGKSINQLLIETLKN